MPRKETTRKRAPAGMCVPYIKTKIKNGKEYTYYEVKCTTGYDPLTGKQKQRTISGKTQKEVIQKYKALQAEVDKGTYVEPCKLTVAEWLDIWLTDYCKTIKPRTLDSYQTNCEIHIKPALGEKKLSKLNSIDVQRFYNGLLNSVTGKPLSPKTVKNIHGTLHKALDRAKRNRLIPVNPADSEFIELPRIDPPEIDPFEDEEITRLIEELSDNPYRIVLLIILFCGLREGEALGLSWECVNWDNHTIRIKQQLQKNRLTKEYEITTTKSKKPRTIYVSDYVLKLLHEQKELQKQMRKAAGKLWDNPWDLIFTREDGRNLCPQTVYCNFKRRVKAIGCSDKRVHDLRHSYAVASLHAGDDIKTVQGNLGHHTAAFTLQTYGHITDGMRRESAAHMNSYIEKVMPKGTTESA